MTAVNLIENFVDNNHNHYSSFIIQPLERGQGITLGNSLRRTLLSELTSFSSTALKINNIPHEFASIPGVKEDVLEILLNTKEIVFKEVFKHFEISRKPKKAIYGFLVATGPILVTAGMLKLPKNTLQIVNPHLPICTIINDSEVFLEIKIENGKDYLKINEEKKKADIQVGNFSNVLLLDPIFSPIKKVNYQVRVIYDSNGNLKESLILEILTNGSITPLRALQDSLKGLLNLFYPLINISLLSKLLNFSDLNDIQGIKKNLYENNIPKT